MAPPLGCHVRNRAPPASSAHLGFARCSRAAAEAPASAAAGGEREGTRRVPPTERGARRRRRNERHHTNAVGGGALEQATMGRNGFEARCSPSTPPAHLGAAASASAASTSFGLLHGLKSTSLHVGTYSSASRLLPSQAVWSALNLLSEECGASSFDYPLSTARAAGVSGDGLAVGAIWLGETVSRFAAQSTYASPGAAHRSPCRQPRQFGFVA